MTEEEKKEIQKIQKLKSMRRTAVKTILEPIVHKKPRQKRPYFMADVTLSGPGKK